MQLHTCEISGLFLVEPKVFGDSRGYFFESFNQRRWEELSGLSTDFVQDNQSRSQRGVVRGLHYQVGASAQGKLLRVLSGEIYDVAVDLRRGSATFGQWFGATLSAENYRQFWIPVGFAHGFMVLSETAEVLYKTTAYYDPAAERSIVWNDPQLKINWPQNIVPLLSDKDAAAGSFAAAEYFD